MPSQSINKKKSVSMFLLYILIVCAVYILPVLKFEVPYTIAAPLMLSTLIPVILKDKRLAIQTIIMCSVFFILTLINILARTAPSITDSINDVLIRNIRFFLPVFWGCYALKYTTEKQRKLFVLCFVILVTFILVKTMSALEIDPWIARILAQGKESASSDINQYRVDNVGGFEFSYMMGIVTLCFTWGALRSKRIWLKVLFTVAVVASFYYIIQTMYTTLLLLTVAGVFLLLFLCSKNQITKVVLLSAALLTIIFLEPILEYLSTAFPKESLLNAKFENFYLAFTEDDVSELGSRPKLIADSFSRWLQAPVFGSYDPNSNAHSLIFSTLENGGIITFIPWLSMFFFGYKMLKRECRRLGVESQLLLVAFLYIAALSFFNPIGYVFEVTIAAFFITPVWLSLTQKMR